MLKLLNVFSDILAKLKYFLNFTQGVFMTKLQKLFVALVNMDIFQMTLKFSLFTVD